MSAADLAALDRLSGAERLAAEMAAVAPYFDPDHYARSLPELPDDVTDLLEHFCTTGWRELRNPSVDFDLWWYWVEHLDPAVESIDPLVHYALVGREQGLSTRPPSTVAGPGATLPSDRPVRRACLFAAFDADGVVDEATLMLIRELSRFSDVFCLYDNHLSPDELAKVEQVARGAWAIRHGAYDFGSYSMLARDLVGWDRLAEYDEVLFVNDSSYLLRPLDEVFAQMDAQACDWWGLQATKGLVMTRDQPANAFTEPIPIDTVRDELLPTYEDDPVYDFHVASYFLAFRRPVLDDPAFRKLVDGVVRQPGKRLIIRKYEIGLTRLLIGHGHRFSTFVPELYPLHPVYTESAFTLIEHGFPMLKRYLIYQNHWDVPGLARWKERVLDLVPDARVDVFEAHLLRTAPADRLARSFAIERDEDGTVRVPAWTVPSWKFVRADAKVPQEITQWAFVVDRATHLLPDNSRAIFDHVAGDPSITKVLLTRSRELGLSGENVVSLPINSPEGRRALMGSGIVLVSDRPIRALGVRTTTDLHHVIAVRRGLTLRKYSRTAAVAKPPQGVDVHFEGPLRMLHEEPVRTFDAILASSQVDLLTAVSANATLRYADAWRTGLPAHDLLLTDTVPDDVRRQEERVREALAGRRLVLFTTTQRTTGSDAEPYPFTPDEVRSWAAAAEAAGAVIGIREPLGDLERAYSRAFGDHAIDLSAVRFPSDAAVLRATDVLVTDFADAALDLTVTDRPVISFVHDLDVARDGLLYDLDLMFPGPVLREAEAVVPALESALADPTPSAQYRRVRDLFVEHRDGRSTARAVERLRALAPKESRS